MSGSAIADGLVTTLRSASAFDAGNVCKDDYGILTTANACALVVEVEGFRNERFTMGNYQKCTWTLGIQSYIKVLGDELDATRRLWALADEVYGAVHDDPHLTSSACDALIVSMDHPIGAEIDFLGNTFLPMFFHVEAWEKV